ncbi:MAG: hypothetical protein H6587_00895 [Flavobacteriales bacterium]|nr:hypothetical protein [Flavobacteriales bacterium]MCB9363102.1 hypothetical protein [Flavobacteriales bacterium]
MKKLTFATILILGLSSCAQIFNGTVLPNQCKRCELINRQTNEILFKNEGCGSENTRLEEEAQLKAYEMSRNSSNLCDLEVRCESWRKEPEDEK